MLVQLEPSPTLIKATTMAIGLQKTIDLHILFMTLVAEPYFQNFFYAIHVMELIRIGNCLNILKNECKLIIYCYSGTKDFIVSVKESENVPWVEIKSGIFIDPREHEGPYNPQELDTFQIDPVMAQFIKFSCTSYYGKGCALQYINVQVTDMDVFVKQGIPELKMIKYFNSNFLLFHFLYSIF